MKTSLLSRAGLALALTFFAAAPHSRGGDLLLSAFASDAIARYDSTLGTFSSFATAPGLMDGPTAMVYGGDGNLYVLCEFSHNVLRFNGTSGAFIDEFISTAALGAAGVTDPDDMELGPDGNFYVTSHGSTVAAAIWKFSGTTGAFVSNFATFGAAAHTHGLTLGPGGKFYLGDLTAGIIRQFNAVTGANLGTFAANPLLSLTADLTFTPDGSLYVACDGNNGIQHFNPSGTFLGSLVAPGGAQSYWGILADGGFLYVSNKATDTLKKYTDTGVFVADITGGPGAFDIIPLVPEPGTGGLLLAGVAGLALGRRWKKPALRAA